MSDAYSRLKDVVVRESERAILMQRDDGAMQPGHNGPYYDPETPVRNTAHWIITLFTAYSITSDNKFRDAAEKAASYLLSKEALPEGSVFYCRNKEGKDKTNGIIGQAWAIEALVEAGIRLNDNAYLDAAYQCFIKHPYDYKVGGWRTVELNGVPSKFDRTFNHQLWFCASGSLLVAAGYKDVTPVVTDFVSRLPAHMRLYNSGLVRHVTPQFLTSGLVEKLIGVARQLRITSKAKYIYMKSVGYHAFNTYALALIERAIPELNLSQIPAVRTAIDYLATDEYLRLIEHSAYGYPYNPPGYEVAYSLKVFKPGMGDVVDEWLGKQLEMTYSENIEGVSIDTKDKVTYAARLYEAARLLL